MTLQRETDGETECIICLSDMQPDEPLVCLPCSGGHAAQAETSAEPKADDQHCDQPKAKSHIFHSECLSRWLLTSAACPTCRRPVRPMLAKARATRCRHRR